MDGTTDVLDPATLDVTRTIQATKRLVQLLGVGSSGKELVLLRDAQRRGAMPTIERLELATNRPVASYRRRRVVVSASTTARRPKNSRWPSVKARTPRIHLSSSCSTRATTPRRLHENATKISRRHWRQRARRNP
jgi:hypothetical protein